MVGGIPVPTIKEASGSVLQSPESASFAEPIKSVPYKTDARLQAEARTKAENLSRSMAWKDKVKAVYEGRLSPQSFPNWGSFGDERSRLTKAAGQMYWDLKKEAAREKNLRAAQERYNRDVKQVAKIRARGGDTRALEQRMRKYGAQIKKFSGKLTQKEFRKSIKNINKESQRRTNLSEARKQRYGETLEAFGRTPILKQAKKVTGFKALQAGGGFVPTPVGPVTKVDLFDLGLGGARERLISPIPTTFEEEHAKMSLVKPNEKDRKSVV